MAEYRIGIDEAGRGPLAGPVAVGVVLVPDIFDWTELPGVTDSKKLSERTRTDIVQQAAHLQQQGAFDYQTTFVGPSVIDAIGIVPAIRRGIARSLAALMRRSNAVEDDVHVLLDGGLSAPETFTTQETVVGGDGVVKEIGLASILAKVRRDRYMIRMAPRYPEYDFAAHKGYGTKTHRECIARHGLSDMHRRSFCANSHP